MAETPAVEAKKPVTVEQKDSESASPAPSPTKDGKAKNLSFVENRRGKEVPHNGFFYTEFKTREACEADTKQLIDSIPHKELIGGYKIIYDERLQTFVGQLLGHDGKIIEDMTTLFNPE